MGFYVSAKFSKASFYAANSKELLNPCLSLAIKQW
jgi:hypothetical protein